VNLHGCFSSCLVDGPLSRARAFLLASDLIRALLPLGQGGHDSALLGKSFLERVANVLLTHVGKGG
jgi:hypothetical protein